ncbi:MAG: type II secretion system GspH family protein [Synergistaceae bacterium]|nr:type II secretion system GspH family protein [Synergistaceae bacterium]
MYNKTARKRAARAFSLVEILVGLLIVSIVGAVIVQTLWLIMSVFSQTEDYTIAHQEIEQTFFRLGGQITNAGLGMPNNKMGVGSFASAFHHLTSPPIMGIMGDFNETWGGPITLANTLSLDQTAFVKTADVTLPDGRKIYGGPVLYYAWSVPTGVHIRRAFDIAGNRDLAPISEALSDSDVKSGTQVRFSLLHDASDITHLEQFRSPYDGRQIGLSMNNTTNNALASTRRWITFPTLRVPFWVSGWNNAGTKKGNGENEPNTLTTAMAPGAEILSADMFTRVFANYEEVHLVQACRLYLDHGTLVQEFFDTGYANASDRVKVDVAQGIVGLYFTFDAERRLLTMHIAARGNDPMPVGKKASIPLAWPNYPGAAIASADLHYRVLTSTMTWRIRN